MVSGFWTASDSSSHARIRGRIRDRSVECRLDERLGLLAAVELLKDNDGIEPTQLQTPVNTR